jgi:feruloyl-CoA synthase
MSDWRAAPYRKVDIWPPRVDVERRGDGSVVLRAPEPLGSYPLRITDRLEHWAGVSPDRTFLAQRPRLANGKTVDWRRVSYVEALGLVRRIGAALVARGLSPERPVLVLSDNGIEHLLLALASMYVGVPYVPVSPAYSLVSKDYGKLRHIVARLTPGLVLASDGERYRDALAAAIPADVEIVVCERPPQGRRVTSFDELCSGVPGPQLEAANAAVGPDTIAKVLFTSGSTGLPKGVINTQRMWCSNIEINNATIFRGMRVSPPVIVDWLPWNHTFGGNANVGVVLSNGGTLYIDEGRPVPGLFDETVRNLREIAPTHYFNVPKGFELLVHHLRGEPALRQRFFSRLDMMFFAGASLAQHIWDGLDEMSVAATGERVVMMTGLGATETGPTALMCTSDGARSGSIGLPCPGVELKLVPNAGKLEARVKGPSVTPGYWREPALTAKAFDDEGFYCFNDAVRFAEPAVPERGLVFDGRIAEDFKLATGTWVSVGPLKARFVAAFAPLARDVVVAGLDRDYLAAIMIPDVEACRAFAGLARDASLVEVARHPALREELAACLAAFRATATGSSTRIERLVVLAEPPSIDAGEITDKGSINQRAVLEHRAGLVEALYASTPSVDIVAIR